MKPYYLAYENRYQKVFEAGVKYWGYSPDSKTLNKTLTKWVSDNKLKGKKIIEFACGEGSCGVILSKLGCLYHGVDIAPSAVEKANLALSEYPAANVSLLDMVNDKTSDEYDAALDVMGFHMLVTDSDRSKYLYNVFQSLKHGAHMLFLNESYRSDAYEGIVNSYDEWKIISGCDYETPEKRTVNNGDKVIDVYIPLVPARAKNREGYIREMEDAGLVVDDFIKMDINVQCNNSVSIYVHKP